MKKSVLRARLDTKDGSICYLAEYDIFEHLNFVQILFTSLSLKLNPLHHDLILFHINIEVDVCKLRITKSIE